jgi:hypothetical protein
MKAIRIRKIGEANPLVEAGSKPFGLTSSQVGDPGGCVSFLVIIWRSAEHCSARKPRFAQAEQCSALQTDTSSPGPVV